MKLKKTFKLALLLTLLSLSMQSVSQTVLINSTKETTTLDKKATVAQGNIVKQRDTLESAYFKQVVLIDSIQKESLGYRNEADTLRLGLTNMHQALEETKKSQSYERESFELQRGILESEVKHQKGKKWQFGTWGLILGSVLTTLAFVFGI